MKGHASGYREMKIPAQRRRRFEKMKKRPKSSGHERPVTGEREQRRRIGKRSGTVARVHGYLQELNEGPLHGKSVTAIFREIISASRSLQKMTTVAFLGPEASFSHCRPRERISENPVAFFRRPALRASLTKWRKAPSTGASSR